MAARGVVAEIEPQMSRKRLYTDQQGESEEERHDALEYRVKYGTAFDFLV